MGKSDSYVQKRARISLFAFSQAIKKSGTAAINRNELAETNKSTSTEDTEGRGRGPQSQEIGSANLDVWPCRGRRTPRGARLPRAFYTGCGACGGAFDGYSGRAVRLLLSRSSCSDIHFSGWRQL